MKQPVLTKFVDRCADSAWLTHESNDKPTQEMRDTVRYAAYAAARELWSWMASASLHTLTPKQMRYWSTLVKDLVDDADSFE